MPTTAPYTLSLHDALPISYARPRIEPVPVVFARVVDQDRRCDLQRSEEHTSELQSPHHLVCCLLLEKKQGRAEPATSSKPTARRRACPTEDGSGEPWPSSY